MEINVTKASAAALLGIDPQNIDFANDGLPISCLTEMSDQLQKNGIDVNPNTDAIAKLVAAISDDGDPVDPSDQGSVGSAADLLGIRAGVRKYFDEDGDITPEFACELLECTRPELDILLRQSGFATEPADACIGKEQMLNLVRAKAALVAEYGAIAYPNSLLENLRRAIAAEG